MSQYTLEDFVDTGHECPTCGDGFDTQKGMKIHHSTVHGESIAGVVKSCEICGSSFRVKPHQADDLVTCGSDQCVSEYKSQTMSGKNHPCWKGGKVTIECHYCGSESKVKRYRADRSERNFCSQGCAIKWKKDTDLSGEKSGAWEGGLVTVECANCGTPKEVKPYRTREFDRQFCGHECKAEWQREHLSGDGNPRWNGGSNLYQGITATLSDKSWGAIAERIRRRDGECQMCGKTPDEVGQELDVHHIVPVRSGGTHADDLLTSLCRSCHMTVEAYTQSIPELEPVLVEE